LKAECFEIIGRALAVFPLKTVLSQQLPKVVSASKAFSRV